MECQRHESLLNLAFADAHGFHLLCPYDTTTLPDAVLYEACRSHPHVAGDVGPSDRPGYRSIDDVAAPLAEPLPEPLSVPHSRVFQAGTLGGLRQFVHHHASAAGFAEDAAEDLVLAVHEVASNSVLHGGGGGVLRIWQEDEAMICEVNDRGVIRDPLAGAGAHHAISWVVPGCGWQTACATWSRSAPMPTAAQYGCTNGAADHPSAASF